jgi:hypothetical protein
VTAESRTGRQDPKKSSTGPCPFSSSFQYSTQAQLNHHPIPSTPQLPFHSLLGLSAHLCTSAAMASVSMRKSYWKSLQTILQEVTTRDNVTFIHPSKLSAIGFVRNPPIDTQAPIQGRVRHPRSNATKEFQSREAARLRKALHAMSHGKHIFVYHHVRTKQVVYSLTRELEVSDEWSFDQSLPQFLTLSPMSRKTTSSAR